MILDCVLKSHDDANFCSSYRLAFRLYAAKVTQQQQKNSTHKKIDASFCMRTVTVLEVAVRMK